MNISVTAAGMVTPVGFNYASSCAAMHAGISAIRQANLWDMESGEYISAARVELPHWWEGLGKLADLAAPAIRECMTTFDIPPRDIPILLGVAAPDRPHRLEGLDDELLDEVEFKLDLPHHPLSKTIARGNVSGLIGLQEADRILDAQLAPACVVAGVDSLLQQNVVEAYLKQRRIITSLNSNGFSPGESGCALLVERTGKSPHELRVCGIGLGMENATISAESPLRGTGITDAVRGALANAGLSIHDTSYRITDLSGEHYKFKEALFVEARFMKRRMERLYDLWHPIEFVGEIGAASLLCLGIALHAGQKGYAPGAAALCHFGNDNGERAAAIVEFQNSGAYK